MSFSTWFLLFPRGEEASVVIFEDFVKETGFSEGRILRFFLLKVFKSFFESLRFLITSIVMCIALDVAGVTL